MRSRFYRAMAVAVVSTALLAVPASTAPVQPSDPVGSALPDGGVVRLHLSKFSSSGLKNYFRFDAADGSGGYTAGTPAPITISQQCQATTTGVMSVSAAPSSASVGFFQGGLGVRAKGEGTGTPCGRVDGLEQSLTLALAAPLTTHAIDVAELDIEAKFNATVRAELYLGTSLQRAETLPTGTKSDSGPDSGDRDNFRWRIPAPDAPLTLFDRVVLRVDPSTPAGAFSLEGGSDGTAPQPGGFGERLGTSDSLFHLVEFDGSLDCGDQASAGETGNPRADLTRLPNILGSEADCVAIPFVLRTGFEGTTQVVFLGKDLGAQAQFEPAFTLTITWEPEPATYPITRATEIDVGDGPHPLLWCDGTPAAPELPDGELWCLAGQSAVPAGPGLIQVTEDIFGSGDPQFHR